MTSRAPAAVDFDLDVPRSLQPLLRREAMPGARELPDWLVADVSRRRALAGVHLWAMQS